MWVWFDTLFGPSTGKHTSHFWSTHEESPPEIAPPPPLNNRRKLHLETLEDRSVPAAIGGSTFYDVNNNGIWNAPEAAAPGVQVSLLPMAGSPASATTDSAGHYSFPGLSTGSYSVSFTAPSGYTVSNPVGGMASVALGTSDATLDAALVGSGSGSGSGTVIGSATTSTGSQSTFTLNGMIGSMHYNIPWGSVDPAQASQSLPLSNFSITVPYGTASQATLTPLNASFTTSPTVQFASGVFTGVNFSIDTSTIAGFDYTSISMSGSTLTAVLPAPNIPLTTTVVANNTQFQVDFANAKTGVAYRIQIKLFNGAGGAGQQVGDTQTIDVAGV